MRGNLGPDEPFGGGEPPGDFDAGDPKTTGQILQFRVVSAVAADPSTPPQFLVLPAIAPLPAAVKTRPLALLEQASEFWDGPAEAMLGIVDAEGSGEHKMWADPVSENPNPGDTEVWDFYNGTADAHPMDVHEITFQVVSRQDLVANEDGEAIPPFRLVGDPTLPELWENGLKDTVISYPGQVTARRRPTSWPERRGGGWCTTSGAASRADAAPAVNPTEQRRRRTCNPSCCARQLEWDSRAPSRSRPKL